MAEKLCQLKKKGGASKTITPVGGTFTTPASSASVNVDCTGYDNVFMYIQRYSSGWSQVYVDLTTNEVSISSTGTGFDLTVTASNHIVSVAIKGANAQRNQVYIKY